jgi:K+-sensing histidine kinase KdpD
MTFPKWATATCVSLLILIVVTTPLWWLRSVVLPGAVKHPVFFYLLPTAVLGMIYGISEGALFAIAAFVCSAFLLYDPIYSFQVRTLRSANSSGSS